MPEPSIGERSRHHADEGCCDICNERDTGQPERIVEDVECYERHKPRQSNEAPAFGFHTGDETLQLAPGLGSHPVGCQIAGC